MKNKLLLISLVAALNASAAEKKVDQNIKRTLAASTEVVVGKVKYFSSGGGFYHSSSFNLGAPYTSAEIENLNPGASVTKKVTIALDPADPRQSSMIDNLRISFVSDMTVDVIVNKSSATEGDRVLYKGDNVISVGFVK